MFYILTCGSTASRWLSVALSRHPELVCFHGLKRLRDPDVPSQGSLAQGFVAELLRLYLTTGRIVIFGAIHGFAASEIAPEMAAIGGSLTAMIRHPITRVNSLFHREMETVTDLDLPVGDIYRPFRERTGELGGLDTFLSANPPSTLARHARRFHLLCNNALAEDAFVLSNLLDADIFRYEMIVHDRDYFRACFKRLAEGCREAIAPYGAPDDMIKLRLECSEHYLDEVFAIPRFNRKNTGADDVEAIFAGWPVIFQQCFVALLARHGGKDAIERYKACGYPLPPTILRQIAAAPPVIPVASSSDAMKPANARRPVGMRVPRTEPQARLKQLLAVIRAERETSAERLQKEQGRSAQERAVLSARINELLAQQEGERTAFTARIGELSRQIEDERAAFTGRIGELSKQLGEEGAAFTARIGELSKQIAEERAAFTTLIDELRIQLDSERAAFTARIEELLGRR